MRRNNGVKFVIVILLLSALSYLLLYGVNVGSFKIPSIKDIRYGIDIKGGVYTVLYTDKENPTAKELESAKTIIERRLDSKGIFDRNVSIDSANNRIVVEIPWKSGEKNFNPQNTIDELGKTALLTFREVDENLKDENGKYKPTDKIVIQGMDVKNATVETDSRTGQVVVALELTEEGAKKFEEATTRLVGKPIAIFMDDQLIVAPIVQEPIPNGRAVINGQRSAKEAGELAATIMSGSLPFRLVAKQVNSISPLLGETALNVTVKAGIVAFILVSLFMIIYYRLPGFLADIALVGLVVMQLLVIVWFGISLTLPGIAGIILSMGMGVDANVIIFERIKEELRAGKTLNAAIDLGFKRAFSAILDANVTTMITAAVLYWLGSGSIKGFGATLFIGVLLSFVTAVTISRIMVKFVSGFDVARNKWLYGLSGRGNQNA